MEQEKVEQAERRKKKEMISERSEKMLQYASIVKETRWPEVSEKKKNELKTLRKELEKRNKKHLRNNSDEEAVDYNKFVNHRVKKSKKKMIWSQRGNV